MNEPIYITVDGRTRELGIYDPTPAAPAPAPVQPWDYTRIWAYVNEGWRPNYGSVRATWELYDELPDAMLLYNIGVHPDDLGEWRRYAEADRDVIRYEGVVK